MIETEHPSSAEGKYYRLEDDSDVEDIAPWHGLLFKKPLQSYLQNAGSVCRVLHIKTET